MTQRTKTVKDEKRYRYETEREFIIEHLAYARGRKSAWEHLSLLAQNCIKANPATLKEVKRLAWMNSHMIRDMSEPNRRTNTKGKK